MGKMKDKEFSEIIEENREKIHDEIMKAYKDQISLQEEGMISNVAIFTNGKVDILWQQTKLDTPIEIYNREAAFICEIEPDDITYWIQGDNPEKLVDEYTDEEIEEFKEEFWKETYEYREQEGYDLIDEAIKTEKNLEDELAEKRSNQM